MDYQKIKALNKRLYFTVTDVAGAMGILQASARVLCSRCVKSGQFVRLKNDFYVSDQKWERLTREEGFALANYLQVPSYISFLSALSYYGLSTQVPQGFWESASLRRTKKLTPREAEFVYYKLRKDLFFDFLKVEGFFIATREKAFADTVYLYSFGKYRFDLSALNTATLNKERLKKILRAFPQKCRKLALKLCAT